MGITPSTALEKCLSAHLPADAVTFPSHIDYQLKVNPYNTDIPVSPVALVRPSTSDQVAEAVKCAVANNVKVQARCGGHSFGNYGLGGGNGLPGALVVDMTKFQKFEMDPSTWRATIGGGTLLGDVTKRLHDNGKRAIAHGTCPQVGVGGHATIGGLGPTSRQFGSTLDHIEEVEVVLANGTVARANANLNQDLFFGIRGAASSFGIVTEFVFRTEPEPASTVHYSYQLFFGKHRDMVPVWETWQSIIADPNLDRKLSSLVIIHELGMLITGSYFGTRAEYNALGFEAKLGKGAIVNVVVMDDWLGSVAHWAETEVLKIFGGIPAPFYSKSLTFSPNEFVPRKGIEDLFAYLDDADKGTLLWFIITDLEGGAINDAPLESTAYGHRDTIFYLQSYAIGLGGLPQASKTFLNEVNNKIKASVPQGNFGAYAGYVDPQLTDGQQQYYGANYPKLRQIKAQLDPNNVFVNPQSVQLP